jgi:type III restriction enzyme
VPLVVLAQARFSWRKASTHVATCATQAATRQFRQLVLQAARRAPGWWSPTGRTRMCLSRAATRRPASRYSGRYQFTRHYFPVLADLKDGGEEFQCAQLIDRHPKVRHWVRNLDTRPAALACPRRAGGFTPTLWPSWWMAAWLCSNTRARIC